MKDICEHRIEAQKVFALKGLAVELFQDRPTLRDRSPQPLDQATLHPDCRTVSR